MVIYEHEGKLDHEDDDATRKPRKRIKKEEVPGSSSSAALTNPNNAETKPAQLFICDICHKIFHKHQALGGHRSSHMKYKCVIINTIEKDMKKARRAAVIKNDDEHADIDQCKKSEAKRTEDSSTTADEDHDGDDNDIGFHDCEQCKRSFTTKKTLELHKITEHSTEKRVLDIDLNMTYQGGEEDI